jgi:hypothetical protein
MHELHDDVPRLGLIIKSMCIDLCDQRERSGSEAETDLLA